MVEETYEYSKAEARKVRLRKAATVIPGVLLIGFLVALYLRNSLAHQLADAMVDHWNWIVAIGLVVAIFGNLAKTQSE